jgi:hypothetical protein
MSLLFKRRGSCTTQAILDYELLDLSSCRIILSSLEKLLRLFTQWRPAMNKYTQKCSKQKKNYSKVKKVSFSYVKIENE